MHVFIAALHRPIKPTGVCRHAANLARCLAEKPEVTKVSLVIGAWQEDYFQTTFALSDKIDLVTVKIKNSSIVRNLWFLQGLPKLADRLNADVVHLAFPFPFLRSRFKAPVVTTVHDLYPYECPENFGFPRVLFNQLFLKLAIANSDALPCVSQITLDKLKFYFPQLKPQQQLEVVYNYVDFAGLETYAPQQITANKKFLLTVAQHRQNKNLDLLIRAYAKLRQEEKIDLDCDLVIVGTTGPETDKIESLIANFNLGDRVYLLSALDDSELGWLYQNCRAFVIPSSTEGFCLPLAEALHFSDRVVCSDIPIFREIATEKCTYFSLENDPLDNLIQALLRVMEHPQALDRKDINRFDRAHIAQQYLNLYEGISQSHDYVVVPST